MVDGSGEVAVSGDGEAGDIAQGERVSQGGTCGGAPGVLSQIAKW